MTPDDLAKHGLRVKRHYFAIYGTTIEQRMRLQTEYEDQICAALEHIAPLDQSGNILKRLEGCPDPWRAQLINLSLRVRSQREIIKRFSVAPSDVTQAARVLLALPLHEEPNG